MSNLQSESIASSESADLLRLKNCPNCQYSLEAHPAIGTCPECGEGYDTSYVILTDDTGEETEPRRKRLRRHFGLGIYCVALIWVGYDMVTNHWTRHTMLFAVLIFPRLIVRGFIWLTIPSYTRSQLWMNAEGFALIPSTEEGRAAQRHYSRIAFWSIPAMYLFFIWTARNREEAIVFAVIGAVSIAISLGIHYAKHHGNNRVVASAEGVPRSLIPWPSLDQCKISESAPGRVRVQFSQPIKLAWGMTLTKESSVNLETTYTHEQFCALQRRVGDWRKPKSTQARA